MSQYNLTDSKTRRDNRYTWQTSPPLPDGSYGMGLLDKAKSLLAAPGYATFAARLPNPELCATVMERAAGNFMHPIRQHTFPTLDKRRWVIEEVTRFISCYTHGKPDAAGTWARYADLLTERCPPCQYIISSAKPAADSAATSSSPPTLAAPSPSGSSDPTADSSSPTAPVADLHASNGPAPDSSAPAASPPSSSPAKSSEPAKPGSGKKKNSLIEA